MQPDTIVARVSRLGVIDYAFAADIDQHDRPAALENIAQRGTWSVWTDTTSPPKTLGDAIEELLRTRKRKPRWAA